MHHEVNLGTSENKMNITMSFCCVKLSPHSTHSSRRRIGSRVCQSQCCVETTARTCRIRQFDLIVQVKNSIYGLIAFRKDFPSHVMEKMIVHTACHLILHLIVRSHRPPAPSNKSFVVRRQLCQPPPKPCSLPNFGRGRK